jgi:hypothetical protein
MALTHDSHVFPDEFRVKGGICRRLASVESRGEEIYVLQGYSEANHGGTGAV